MHTFGAQGSLTVRVPVAWDPEWIPQPKWGSCAGHSPHVEADAESMSPDAGAADSAAATVFRRAYAGQDLPWFTSQHPLSTCPLTVHLVVTQCVALQPDESHVSIKPVMAMNLNCCRGLMIHMQRTAATQAERQLPRRCEHSGLWTPSGRATATSRWLSRCALARSALRGP